MTSKEESQSSSSQAAPTLAEFAAAVASVDKPKDLWDRISVVTNVTSLLVTTLVLGCAGLWFTHSYNQSQLRIAEARNAADMRLREIEIIESFIPHLEKGGQSRTAALFSINSLGSMKTMIALAELYGDPESINAVAKVLHASEDATARQELTRAFQRLTGAQLTIVTFKEEERSKVLQRQEQRTRTVTRSKPLLDENGQPKRNEAGEIVMVFYEVEELYEVSVPYTETYVAKVSIPNSFELDQAIAEVLSGQEDQSMSREELKVQLVEKLQVDPEITARDDFQLLLEAWILARTIPAKGREGSHNVRLIQN